MKVVLLVVVWCFLFFAVVAGEAPNAFEMNERLGRGINMGNTFEAPTEQAWGNPWDPSYFQKMAELGFSHVRIPVRWDTPERTLQHPPYTISAEFLERIKEAVDTALNNGLHAIVNMHHHDDLFINPLGEKDKFLAQWAQIAAFFQDYPDSLVFEVLNEPHNNLTPDLWNEFFSEALEIIRLTNPTRTVLLGTALFGGLAGVPLLNMPDDPYVILSVHYYNPFNFTHQGAEWVGQNADEWMGTQWFDTQAERDAIVDEFAITLQLSQEHNIPVHVGEFGAYSTADLTSRVRWTTFLARWFEELGFSWAYWEFSAGFGIFNPATGQYIIPLVNALLSNPMPDPIGVSYVTLLEDNLNIVPGGWSLNANGGAQATLSGASGEMIIQIDNSGNEMWHIQLFHPEVSLVKGELYRATFHVAPAAPRYLVSYLGRASAPWTAYSGYNSYSLLQGMNSLSFTFQMISESDPNARWVFDLGESDTDVTFHYFHLEQLNLLTSIEQGRAIPFRVFPNPVSDLLMIKVQKAGSLILFDLSGRELRREWAEGPTHQLDMSDLPSGVYLVSLTHAGGVDVRKILKY